MKSPWFRFFPVDWLCGTSELSAGERGVYITLIAKMYDHGGAIPRDDARLARLCGLPVVGFRRALETLIEQGKITTEGDDLFNPRAKREVSERENRVDISRQNANSRWKKSKQNQHSDSKSASDPHMQKPCSLHSHIQRDLGTSPKSIPAPALRAFVERFYRAYPKHVYPRLAEKAFGAAVKRGVDPEKIIAAAEAFAEATRAAGTEKQFIKAPSVWLNAGGYDSEDLPKFTPPEARAGPVAAPVSKDPYTLAVMRIIGEQNGQEQRFRADRQPASDNQEGSDLLDLACNEYRSY